jgi:hypothetical protein
MGAWQDPKVYKLGIGRESSFINTVVRAIQAELLFNNTSPGPVDGIFGLKTQQAVKNFQSRSGLGIDGVIGPKTARSLFDKRARFHEGRVEMPGPYLHGLMRWESAYDPGAIGPNGVDTGLVQINLDAHKDITNLEALDPAFAVPYAANRMRSAADSFASKPDLAWKCAIAQHNSPRKAKQWFEVGVPPDDQIALYVSRIGGG